LANFLQFKKNKISRTRLPHSVLPFQKGGQKYSVSKEKKEHPREKNR
jgi:hypothetical protein